MFMVYVYVIFIYWMVMTTLLVAWYGCRGTDRAGVARLLAKNAPPTRDSGGTDGDAACGGTTAAEDTGEDLGCSLPTLVQSSEFTDTGEIDVGASRCPTPARSTTDSDSLGGPQDSAHAPGGVSADGVSVDGIWLRKGLNGRVPPFDTE